MTVPSYTTDLQTVDLAEAKANWAELSGHTGGSAPADETENYIQGSQSVSQTTGVKTGTTCGLQADYGSNISWTSGFCIFAWMMYAPETAMDTFANGGLRMGIGSTSGNMNYWIVSGNDYGRNPYGGWSNFAVDPEYTPVDYVDGSPSFGNYRIIGSWPNILSAISKGYPHAVDAIRSGRGELKIEYGEAANYGTFAGIAAINDASGARWGLFQELAGTYLWKGLLSFGNSTNPCDFRDSNRVIIIDDCPRTYAAFNKIEINNASSRVDWTTISFISTGTLAPGLLEVVNNADINIDGCSFTDMNTFIFQSNSAIINSIFQSCGLITAAGADFDGSKILESSVAADASALGWNVATDPDGLLDNMTFSKGTNAHHAIEFGTTSPLTMTVRGMTTTGFNASNAQNNSTFHVKRTSGTVTINVVGGTGNFSYKTAGATVNIVIDPITVKVHAGDIEGTDIENARVFLKAKDGTGPFPFEESITIVNSGTTATVTHATHGMASNDYVDIKGASLAINNGVHQITKIDDGNYSYTMSSSPGSSPTGTITSTFVALTGLTNASGDKSTSRTYPSNQPVTGWVRLTPSYKTAPLFGTVNSSDGYNSTGVLIPDE